MANPNFSPTYSTNEIWRDTSRNRCLTDDLDAIESDIETLETGKADADHTHTGYAAANHSHSYNDLTNKPTIPTIPSSLPANGGNADTVDGKHAAEFAAAGHSHTDYAPKSHTHAGFAAANHTHTEYAAASHTHSGYAATNHTHTGYAASGHTHSYNDLTNKPTIPSIPASLPANGGNADTLDGKHASAFASAAHVHGTTPVTEANTNLNDYAVAGVYSFSVANQPVNRPSGTSNGWLVVVPWTSNPTTQTVKQFWLRHGGINSTDHEVYTRTKIGDYGWSSWAKVITSKDMTITKDNGDVYVSWTGQDVVAKLTALAPGMYTAYSRSGTSAGTTNAPNGTEGFRYIIHKTGENTTNYGWVLAFGTSGSVYAGYHDAGTWRGWRALYKGLPDLLWSGVYYMSASQTVTPTKKLSECRTGWMLLWSDYDASTGTANDGDFVTTIIPKLNPSGGTWAGKSFYCDVPRYIGANQSDVATESRIIKMIYVHDNKIVGHAANNQGVRSDVVLRAVYEV